jgi:hypothetical protein
MGSQILAGLALTSWASAFISALARVRRVRTLDMRRAADPSGCYPPTGIARGGIATAGNTA